MTRQKLSFKIYSPPPVPNPSHNDFCYSPFPSPLYPVNPQKPSFYFLFFLFFSRSSSSSDEMSTVDDKTTTSSDDEDSEIGAPPSSDETTIGGPTLSPLKSKDPAGWARLQG